MEFKAHSWHPVDEDGNCKIYIFGLTLKGKSVVVKVDDFSPWVYLELPHSINWKEQGKILSLQHAMNRHMKYQMKWVRRMSLLWKKKLYYANVEENDQGELVAKTYPFLKVELCSIEGRRKFAWGCKKEWKEHGLGDISFKVHEIDATPQLQLAAQQNMKMGGWNRVSKYKFIPGDEKETNWKWEISACTKHLSGFECNDIVEPVVLSYDIECFSSIPTAMPKATRIPDVCFQISCVFSRGEKKKKKYCLCLKDTSQKFAGNDVELRIFKHESDLLLGFRDIIQEKNPQVIIGWNIDRFDLPYMMERAKLELSESEFVKQGCFPMRKSEYKQISWSSSAYKAQEFHYLDTFGRVHIDLLPEVKRNFSFETYQLGAVATHFLGDTKEDMPPKEMFKCWQRGTPEDLGRVASYCVKDADLVSRLFYLLKTWPSQCEMSSICFVPILNLSMNGQQLKVFSQVYHQCLHDNFVVEKDAYIPKADEHFSGAMVFEPKPGLYEQVIPMDFCLAGDTMVTMANGMSKMLVQIKDKDRVMGFQGDGIRGYKTIGHVKCKGQKETIKLFLEDSRSVTCTPDHKFMTCDGELKQAGELTPNDKLLIGLEGVEDKECPLEGGWSLDVHEFKIFTMDTEEDRQQTLAFARILGFIMSDGSVYINNTTAGQRRIYCEVCLGSDLDACIFRRDIELLGGNVSVRFRNRDGTVKGSTYTISLPAKFARAIASIDGIVIGKRCTQAASLPRFICDPNCPLSIIREFLGGLFGGDGVAPCLTRSKWKRFAHISFKWTIVQKHEESMISLMKQLQQFIGRFNIPSTLSRLVVKYGKNSIKPHDWEDNPRIDYQINLLQKDTLTFGRKIGFRYCMTKMMRLSVVMSYQRLTETVRQQHDAIVKNAIKLHTNGKGTMKNCIEISKDDVNSTNFTYYSNPTESIVTYAKRRKSSYKYKRGMRLGSDFPDALEYVTKLGVSEWFDKGAYCFEQKSNSAPCFKLGVIGTQSNGLQNVYDITVDESHTFLSQGIVTSNCSLYPSIIIAYNISWDTLVRDDWIPDSMCHIIAWSDHLSCEHDTTVRKTKPKNIICGEFRFRFLKSPIGVLPTKLKNLLAARKATRKIGEGYSAKAKAMDDPKCPEALELLTTAGILDARQLALKVSCNSMYGALGVSKGYLPFMPGAMCTTAKGRESVILAAKVLKEEHNAHVVYGDSVTGDTPIFVRMNGKIQRYIRIDELEGLWECYHTDKLSYVPEHIEVWTEQGWTTIKRVIKHKTTKRLIRVLTNSGVVDVTEDHSLLDEQARKVTPNEIKVGQKLLLHDFPELGKDDFENDYHEGEIDIKGKITAADFYRLCVGLGYSVSINTRKDKLDIYRLTISHKPRLDPAKIKKIEELPTVGDCFVYDLETESHHFAAGVGRLVVHNTDSCMVQFPGCPTAQDVWDHSLEVEKAMTKHFPDPMRLEFEKIIYQHYLIFTKKRYGIIPCYRDGVLAEEPKKKGIMSVRRGYTPHAKKGFDKLLMMVLRGGKRNEIVYFITQLLLSLPQRQVPLSELIITTSLNNFADYKSPALPTNPEARQIALDKKNAKNDEDYRLKSLPAHVQLAQRMIDRGEIVDTGSRISWIILENENRNAKKSEKIEDPNYFIRHRSILRLDYLHYVKQFINALDEVVETVWSKTKVFEAMYKQMLLKEKLNKYIVSLKKFKLAFDEDELGGFENLHKSKRIKPLRRKRLIVRFE